MAENIKWHGGHVSKEEKKLLLDSKNKVIWLTGLSGSGKSTIARILEKRLHDDGVHSFVLDGDNVRHGLNKDLGFSAEDRKENIRRISEVAKLFYDSGTTVIVCFISPYREDRKMAKDLIGEDFLEVYIKASLEECENRDPKGLYKKVRAGEINEFTGISDPYEEPLEADIVIDTGKYSEEECVDSLMRELE